MTDTEKRMIIAFFYYLESIIQVARIIGWPWSTVKSFLAQACERISIDNLPQFSRPPVLSCQQCETIIHAAESNH